MARSLAQGAQGPDPDEPEAAEPDGEVARPLLPPPPSAPCPYASPYGSAALTLGPTGRWRDPSCPPPLPARDLSTRFVRGGGVL